MKLKLPSLRLTSSLLFLATAAHAQAAFSIGPRVGLNLTTYRFSEKSILGTPGYRPGMEAGVASSWGLGHFALQTAALYSQKGCTQHYTVDIRTGSNIPAGTGDAENSSRLHYLTIPLSIAYTQGSDGQGAQVFAGPYLGVLLGGRYETTITPNRGTPTSNSGPITPVSNEAPDISGAYARRLDAGLQAGLGYRHRALLFQVAYSLGLRNVAASYFYNGIPVSSPAYYNRAFQGSLTYLFGK